MTDLFAEDLNAVIRQQSEALAKQLHAQRESLFPPDAQKQMRKFTSGEAAALLGVNDSYLRKLHLDGKGPSPETTAGNRRLYSAQDLQDLRELLEKTARKPGDYLPGRRGDDHLQIIGQGRRRQDDLVGRDQRRSRHAGPQDGRHRLRCGPAQP